MFEKEAEEYAVLNARQYIHNEDIGFCTSEEEVRQAYQEGAEFGYNKAKEELEEENAELKEQCSVLADCNTCHSTCKNENIEMKKQLTKAKELIEELSSSLSVVGECGEEECELLNRAEQFLNSEVE